MALNAPIETVAPGAGPQLRDSIDKNFTVLDGRIPAFDPVADEGKVLKIVSGVATWAADAT